MGDRQAAMRFYNQGAIAVGDKANPDHLKHGYQLFSSACMTDPTWSTALYQCGNNNSDLECLPAAIACWRRAIQCEIEPQEKAKALCNMAWRLHCLGKTQEALATINESISIDPNNALAWVNKSCMYQILCDAKESLSAAQTGYALAPTDPTVELSLAFAHLFGRNLATGFKHFECRFAYKLKSYLQFPYQKWTGQENVTVYLDADQGLGDTLSFARFVPLAAKRAKYIHACVQPELRRLFEHAFVGLPNVNVVSKPCGFLPADYWTTFVSLPFALGLSDQEIIDCPNITVPKGHTPINWRIPDRKLHVGIAWAGSDLNNINPHRSIPVEQFFDLCRVPGIQLYAFQCDRKRDQMYDRGGSPLVVDMARIVVDVMDTIAMIQKLDLIICCESALGHIAAAAGVECWIPYSYLGRDYRLGLAGEDSFWTPKHRVFNQGPSMTWQPVFNEIVEALKERVA